MDVTNAADLWDRVVGAQPDPTLWLVASTGLIALAVVVFRTSWRISRNAITIAHEGRRRPTRSKGKETVGCEVLIS